MDKDFLVPFFFQEPNPFFREVNLEDSEHQFSRLRGDERNKDTSEHSICLECLLYRDQIVCQSVL